MATKDKGDNAGPKDAPPPNKQNFAQQPMDAPKKPEEIIEQGEETVTMVFPKAVVLNVDNHVRVAFPEGPQEVPARLKDHWWLVANGVKAYGRGSAKAKA